MRTTPDPVTLPDALLAFFAVCMGAVGVALILAGLLVPDAALLPERP